MGSGLRRHRSERVACMLTCSSTRGTTLTIAPQKHYTPHLLRQHVLLAWSSPNGTGWLARELEGSHISASSAPGLESSPTTHSFSFYVGPRYRTQVLVFAQQVLCPLSYGPSPHQRPLDVMGLTHLTEKMDLMLFRLGHFSYLCLAENCFLQPQSLWPVTSCSWCVKRFLRALKHLWATCSATHIRPPYNQCFFWHDLSVNQELEREWPDLTSRRAVEFRLLMFVFPPPNEVI